MIGNCATRQIQQNGNLAFSLLANKHLSYYRRFSVLKYQLTHCSIFMVVTNCGLRQVS